MKNVLITGSSSGIGHEISKVLLDNGYTVYGISRTSANIDNDNFHEFLFNLTDIKLLTSKINELISCNTIDCLINNAGCAYYGLHEELNPVKIHEMVTVNLEVPMVLTNLLLRMLKSVNGNIINISSVTASKTNPHGAAYGATKSGLSSFGKSIFDEARKYGIKVTNIYPDMTSTNLYRNADFECSDEEGCCLLPSDVSNAVMYILSSKNGINVEEITLTPQFHRISRKAKDDNRQ